MPQPGRPGVMSTRNEITFATKVDPWLAVLMILVLGGGGFAMVREFAGSPAEAWPAALLFVAVASLVLVLTVPTRYTVTARELVIRSGILRSSIPLDSIHRVYPTRNPVASPAWSLDRLGVEHRTGRVGSLALISPEPREEFLQLVQSRTGLRRTGGELVRDHRHRRSG